MSDGGVNSARPNIRIEIHNNLMDSMDIDGPVAKLSDGEEGEIIEESVDFDDILDNKINYLSRPNAEQPEKTWKNTTPKSFATFDIDDDKKRSDRAKRFQLEHDEVINFTTENLDSLHESLGINARNENGVCFDTLHLYGIENMTSTDIMEYFIKYGPVAIEWVKEDSCNVMFSDDISSARALHYMSKVIKGMPVEQDIELQKGKSILLKNNNREVQMDDDEPITEDQVTVSEVSDLISIPAGYWRLGAPFHKCKCILTRFALVSDRKLDKNDKSEYKKHGNGVKGIISESKKAQFRGIFERNRDISTKNPWGDLARSWNRDKKTEEVVEDVPQPTPQLKNRLGFKRTQAEAFVAPETEEKIAEKPKIPRMRMYADEEEAKIKRKKALEAVKRVAKPVKQEPTNAIGSGASSSDLRNVIRRKDGHVKSRMAERLSTIEHDNRDVEEEDDSEEEEGVDNGFKREFDTQPIRAEADLGNRLKNRRLKFNNSVPLAVHKRNETVDVRQRIDNKVTKQHRFRDELIRSKRLKSPPPPPRHTNKIYSRSNNVRHNKYEEPSYEDEDYSDDDLNMKTNSKVTVVVKKHKQPTVASTVWSRVNTTTSGKPNNSAPSVKDRLQMPAKSRRMKESSASSGDSSDDSSSSSDEDEDMSRDIVRKNAIVGEEKIKPSYLERPGFRGGLISDRKEDHKSPLRIEINNDHYKK